MADYGTNAGEKFAKNALEVFFERAIAPDVSNSDYEGEIKGGGADRVNILTFGSLSLQDYVPGGSPMNIDTPTESEGQLVINQRKAYYFQIDDLLKFQSYVSNPESALIQNAGKILAEEIDKYILGHHTKVAAGQRIGTPETTGTVSVASDGTVTGIGTAFHSSMVGKGFKAAGHTQWYRIKSVASTTSMVIEDDLDDVPSQYSGGSIAAGATYEIEAAKAVQITYANIYDYVLKLKAKLDKAKIPQTDRFLVVNSDVAGVLLKATELIPAVPTAYENVVLKGILGTVSGFKVYQNEQLASSAGSDGVTGYWVLAGHKSAITFAMAFTESGVEDLVGQFGKAYKGLNVYGAKVLDERRKALAALYCKL